MNDFAKHLDTLVGPVISSSVSPMYNHYLSSLVEDILNKEMYDYTPGHDMEVYHACYEQTLTRVKRLMIKDGYAKLMKVGDSEFVIIFETCDVGHYVTLAEESFMATVNIHIGKYKIYRTNSKDGRKPWEVN